MRLIEKIPNPDWYITDNIYVQMENIILCVDTRN